MILRKKVEFGQRCNNKLNLKNIFLINFKANLPPTLSKSQLDSVKKQMKLQLISILKHPQCGQHSKIIDILIDLGMSQSEVSRIEWS